MTRLDIKKQTVVFVLLYLFAGKQAYGYLKQGELFQKLSDAGIDKVVELPYNTSIVALLNKQVRVHNIADMENNELPQSSSLLEEFHTSNSQYQGQQVLPELSYAVGEGACEYMEAVKVNETLVCYRRAHLGSVLATSPTSRVKTCGTHRAKLAHCYIFAHHVDDVIAALSAEE